MRILLTGATGFIGRHCLPLLVARGYEVHAVSSQPRVAVDNDVHWHQADLLDPGQVRALFANVKPSHLLHFAWYAVPGQYWTSLENLRWVQASLNCLQAFAQYGGQRVVMAGTCAEYDWRYGYCSEQVTPLAPVTLYGVCKHALQTMLTIAAQQTGLRAAWGRVFFLYGPYESPQRLVASVIRALIQGKPALCSNGNQIRDFLYVEDVARAFLALLDSNVQGPVNIASGLPVMLKTVIQYIAERLNEQDLIRLGALPVAVNEPPMLVADVRCLTHEVGWTPGYDLHHGLEKTIDWWRDSIANETRKSSK